MSGARAHGTDRCADRGGNSFPAEKLMPGTGALLDNRGGQTRSPRSAGMAAAACDAAALLLQGVSDDGIFASYRA